MPTLIVEFAAVQGAGKSTTAKGLVARLRKLGCRVTTTRPASVIDMTSVRQQVRPSRRIYTLLRMVLLTAYLALRFPLLAGRYMWLSILSWGQPYAARRPPWGLLSAFQYHALRRSHRRRSEFPPEIVVMEESVYMDVVNTVVMAPLAASRWIASETLSPREGIVRVVVFLECRPEILQKRLVSRSGHTRSRKLASCMTQLRQRCRVMRVVRRKVEALAHDTSGTQVIVTRTDHSSTVAEVVDDVSEQVLGLWNRLVADKSAAVAVRS